MDLASKKGAGEGARFCLDQTTAQEGMIRTLSPKLRNPGSNETPAKFLLRRARGAPYSSPRMFRFRLFPLAALAGLLLVFNSCERHHVGEIPELQQEHFNPMEAGKAEREQAAQPQTALSPTPADFFPRPAP